MAGSLIIPSPATSTEASETNTSDTATIETDRAIRLAQAQMRREMDKALRGEREARS
jgi:hypothetical protein